MACSAAVFAHDACPCWTWSFHGTGLLPLLVAVCQSGSMLTHSTVVVGNLGVEQAPTPGFRTVFSGPSKDAFGSHPKAAAVCLAGHLWSLLL